MHAQPAAPQRPARLRGAARHLSMKEAAARTVRDPRCGQSVGARTGGTPRHAAVPPRQPLAGADRGRAGYFAPIRHAFRQIGEATRRLQAMPQAGMLTVSAPPAFAASWLVPRLGRFSRASPGYRTQHRHHAQTGEFRGRWRRCCDPPRPRPLSGLRCDRIATIAMIPVCGPGFLAAPAASRPKEPADLLGLGCCKTRERQDWALWFQAQGVDDHRPDGAERHQLRRPDAADARRGSHQGIALVTETLARPELERRQPGARAGCRLAAGVCLLAGRPARHRRSAEDRRVPRLAAGRRPAASMRTRVQPGEQRRAEGLEALVVHASLPAAPAPLRRDASAAPAW